MGSAPSRKTRRRGRAPMAEINVTPMVDVMLVLLIIFMVTAPLLKAGVPLELPDSKAKALGDDANQITISLSRGGALFLDNAEVLPGELAVRLATFERDDKGRLPPITLRADKGLDYGRVMAVMGELNRAGFSQIALVTTAAAAVSDGAVSDGSGSGD